MEMFLDKPITSRRDDKLGRTHLAENIGELIIRFSQKYNDNLVIGIIGPWGSGKTSLINMVKEYIIENDEDRIIIVEFSPWYYSGYSDLISTFFDLLADTLGRLNYERMKDISEGAEKLAKVLKTLKFVPILSTVGETASATADFFKKLLEEKLDIKKQKEELSELLSKQDKRILVVIDDIDRLSYQEIAQIFQLVKALADFPNTIYLLAFDRDIVSKELNRIQEGYGDKYIEKVVQLQIDLPPVSKFMLIGLLEENFKELLSDIPEDRIEEERFEKVKSYLLELFSTLREAYRYLNVLKPTFELVKDEVDPLDFFLITALKVSVPEVYEAVKNHVKNLVVPFIDEPEQRFSFMFSYERYLKRSKSVVSRIVEKGSPLKGQLIKEILEYLFPLIALPETGDVGETLSEFFSIGRDLEKWGRVGSIKYVDLY